MQHHVLNSILASGIKSKALWLSSPTRALSLGSFVLCGGEGEMSRFSPMADAWMVQRQLCKAFGQMGAHWWTAFIRMFNHYGDRHTTEGGSSGCARGTRCHRVLSEQTFVAFTKKSICLLNQMFIDYKSIVTSFQDETKVSDVHSLLRMSQTHYFGVVLQWVLGCFRS